VRRVLKTGGRFLFSVWDGIAENAFADTVTQALATLFPHDPPRFLARTLHGYSDVDRIRAELRSAGSPTSRWIRSTGSAPRRHRCIRQSPTARAPPLRNEIEARSASRLRAATEHAAEAIAGRFGPGAVRGPVRAFVLTATA
jgi:hypothetical protein